MGIKEACIVVNPSSLRVRDQKATAGLKLIHRIKVSWNCLHYIELDTSSSRVLKANRSKVCPRFAISWAYFRIVQAVDRCCSGGNYARFYDH